MVTERPPPQLAPAEPAPGQRSAFEKWLRSNLVTRIVSALVLAPVVLAVLWLGGMVLLFFIAGVCALAAAEWAAMVAVGATPGAKPRAGVLAAVGAMLGISLSLAQPGEWALVVLLTGALLTGALLATVVGPQRRGLAALGMGYVMIGCAALAWLATAHETSLIVYVVLVVWATDIGAYAAGRAIGGPKLAPRISPKKTWAGLFGGMAAAAVVGAAMAWWLAAPHPFGAAALAAVLAVVAQAGDLLESFVKRRVGVKDSSRLIPGHGGLLDRIDGLLAAAPALALAVWSGLPVLAG